MQDQNEAEEKGAEDRGSGARAMILVIAIVGAGCLLLAVPMFNLGREFGSTDVSGQALVLGVAGAAAIAFAIWIFAKSS